MPKRTTVEIVPGTKIDFVKDKRGRYKLVINSPDKSELDKKGKTCSNISVDNSN